MNYRTLHGGHRIAAVRGFIPPLLHWKDRLPENIAPPIVNQRIIFENFSIESRRRGK